MLANLRTVKYSDYTTNLHCVSRDLAVNRLKSKKTNTGLKVILNSFQGIKWWIFICIKLKTAYKLNILNLFYSHSWAYFSTFRQGKLLNDFNKIVAARNGGPSFTAGVFWDWNFTDLWFKKNTFMYWMKSYEYEFYCPPASVRKNSSQITL